MKIRPLLTFVFIVLAARAPLLAAPGEVWTYDRLRQEADLIVIATPLASKDTGENTVLPGIQEVDAKGEKQPVAALGVETSLSVVSVLKGSLLINSIVLYHLRQAAPPAQPGPGAPRLASFNSEKHLYYLMYLKKDKDGRYVSVTGQTDPAIGIKDLGPGL